MLSTDIEVRGAEHGTRMRHDVDLGTSPVLRGIVDATSGGVLGVVVAEGELVLSGSPSLFVQVGSAT
jgi:hypothetical protein